MLDLFGNEVRQIGSKPKNERMAEFQYKQLTSIYGMTAGKRCKDCKHCQQHEGGSKNYYKCNLATISRSRASDWNSRWPACGKFEQE